GSERAKPSCRNPTPEYRVAAQSELAAFDHAGRRPEYRDRPGADHCTVLTVCGTLSYPLRPLPAGIRELRTAVLLGRMRAALLRAPREPARHGRSRDRAHRQAQMRMLRHRDPAVAERPEGVKQDSVLLGCYENFPNARSVAHQISLLPPTIRTPNTI